MYQGAQRLGRIVRTHFAVVPAAIRTDVRETIVQGSCFLFGLGVDSRQPLVLDSSQPALAHRWMVLSRGRCLGGCPSARAWRAAPGGSENEDGSAAGDELLGASGGRAARVGSDMGRDLPEDDHQSVDFGRSTPQDRR